MRFYERLFLLLAVCAASATASGQAGPPERDFIVVLKENAGPPNWIADDVAERYGGQVGYLYQHALKGFSVRLPLTAVAAVAKRPDVAYIERDLPMSIVTQDVPTGIFRSFAAGNANLDIDGADDFRVDADVAVVDTGIDLEHPDLNVVGGTDCTLTVSGGGPFATRYCGAPGEGTGGDDDNSHGTHVGGTIGALDNGIGVVGVAPGARLWAVKVLNSQGSGYTSGIIAGIDWVVAQGDIEVLNMSLGGSGVSSAYKDAIDNAVENGVVVVVAAGNSDMDASNYSPAYVPSAITVSALADFDGLEGGFGSPTCRSDVDDTLANFSNWGAPVDIAAPGVCIFSTLPVEEGGYGTYSGTSMAAPHVAGAAAVLSSGANVPTNAADVQAIRDTLVSAGNLNWVDDSGDGIHEPLLDVSTFSPTMVAGEGDGGGGESTNTPPTASFTYSCSDLSCTFDGSGSSSGDGTITAYDWDFGDGNIGSGVTTNHTFDADGKYAVRLTVIEDNETSDVDTDVQDVTVSSDSGGGSGSTLLSSGENNGSTWTANVWRDDRSALSGAWSTGATCSSATTCTLSGIPKRESSVTFTSDSGGQVTVLKP